MCNTYKNNKKDGKHTKTYYPTTAEQLPHTILNNVEHLHIIYENVGLINQVHIPSVIMSHTFGQDVTTRLRELLKVDFELVPANGYSGLSCVI